MLFLKRRICMLRSRIGLFFWILGVVLYCYGRSTLLSPTSYLMHNDRSLWFILVDLSPFVIGLWLGGGVAGTSFSLHKPLLFGSVLLAVPFLYYLLNDFGLFGVSGVINVFRPDEPIACGFVLVLSVFPPQNLKRVRNEKVIS